MIKKSMLAVVLIFVTAFTVMGCTTTVPGSPLKAPSVQSDDTNSVPRVVVPESPDPTLEDKLRAIPGIPQQIVDRALEYIETDEDFLPAVAEGCIAGLSRDFFVDTAMSGADEDGDVSDEMRVILTQVFEVIWDHYCVRTV